MKGPETVLSNKRVVNIWIPIITIALVSECVFFSTMAILGRVYEGSNSSLLYRYYVATLTFLAVLSYIKTVTEKRRVRVAAILLALLPIWLVMISLLTRIRYGANNVDANNSLLYILVWTTTGIYTGLTVASRDCLFDMVKWFDIVMMVSTTGGVMAVLSPFFGGDRIVSIGGATYQAAAYYSAFSFGINLFFVTAKSNLSFKRLSNPVVRIARMILLPIQVLCTLLSGGRGGAILAAAYILVFLMLGIRKTAVSLSKILILLMIGALVVATTFPLLQPNPVFQTQIRRVFSYWSNWGIDVTQTSGRDVIYEQFLQLILQKPILGRGLLSYYYEYNRYPHNIILEILTEGGIVYLFLWICIGMRLFTKVRNKIRTEPNNTFFLVLFIFTMTRLFFSGSYIIDPVFWFCVSWASLMNDSKVTISSTS